MSKISKKIRHKKNIEHQRYISRITKTLYYGKFPNPDELSLPVTELAAELFSAAHKGRSLDRLHYDDAASISRNACVSPCSLVIAILYLEKLRKRCPKYIEQTASSDLFLVSLMVSCKFLYDDGEEDEVFLDQWATSGGTTVKQLIQLEKDFLRAMDWEIFVNEPTFWKKLEEIENSLAKKQGISRGFFTYTELQILLATLEVYNLLQNIMAVSLILIASYTTAIVALFGSVAIVSHIPGTCLQPKSFDVNQSTVAIAYEPIRKKNIEKKNLLELDLCKQEYKLRNEFGSTNILKRSSFQESVEPFLQPLCNKSDVKYDIPKERNIIQNVSWDWWNTPAMKWLSETAAYMTNVEFHNFPSSQQIHETISNPKYWTTEDLISRPIKLRIKNYKDKFWYVDWTGSIKNSLHKNYLQNHAVNVRS